MRRRKVLALLAASALACGEEPAPEEAVGPEALRAHSAEFEQRIYPVTEGVHAAVGYALANSILIEGDGGAIVVDVTGTVESAARVRAEFEKITDQPIVALVYTHNHADHVFGGRGFVPDGNVEVFAHQTTGYYVDRIVSIIRPVIARRSGRMFGNNLPAEGPDAFINAGIGPFLEIGGHEAGTLSFLPPTRIFDDTLEVTVAGVRMELVQAPDETNDQIFVWLPDKKVLLPGDNVYKAFPNLYTIRGTTATCWSGCAASTGCATGSRSSWCRATPGRSPGGSGWRRC